VKKAEKLKKEYKIEEREQSGQKKIKESEKTKKAEK
jgi:hypothetical protein